MTVRNSIVTVTPFVLYEAPEMTGSRGLGVPSSEIASLKDERWEEGLGSYRTQLLGLLNVPGWRMFTGGCSI